MKQTKRITKNKKIGNPQGTSSEVAIPPVPQIGLNANDITYIIRKVQNEQGNDLTQGNELAQTLPTHAQGLVEETSMQLLVITKNQLHLIYNLPSMHQPQKFIGAKDLVTVEKWLKSIESVMALFDMID